MRPLTTWRELPTGGTVAPADAPQPQTGSWRTGVRPIVEFDRCINCLLCWLYCPDTAVRLEDTTFMGFDLDFCKGCEICAEVCPVDAIEMEVDDAV